MDAHHRRRFDDCYVVVTVHRGRLGHRQQPLRTGLLRAPMRYP